MYAAKAPYQLLFTSLRPLVNVKKSLSSPAVDFADIQHCQIPGPNSDCTLLAYSAACHARRDTAFGVGKVTVHRCWQAKVVQESEHQVALFNYKPALP